MSNERIYSNTIFSHNDPFNGRDRQTMGRRFIEIYAGQRQEYYEAIAEVGSSMGCLERYI